MRFADAPAEPRAEAIVPMINVVFLLLIFFLMTATIAPPDPLDVVPPEAGADPADPTERVLHLGAEGAMAYGADRGEAALAAAIAGGAAGQGAGLTIRADGRLEGAVLARLLTRLAAAGVGDVQLVTVAR